jgi:tetratricopeptide (TPR) repeat protein
MAELLREALHALWRLLRTEAVDEEHARRSLDLAGRATAAIGELDPASGVDLALPLLHRLPAELAVKERVEAERARAVLLLRLRKTDEAQRVLDQALERHAEAIGPALQGSLLVDIAAALEQSGQPEAARAQLGEALRVLAQVPPEQRARALDALLALARSHLKARELPKAREVLGLAHGEGERRNTATARIDVLSVRAALEQAEGNMDAAVATLLEALAVAQAADDEAAEARIRQQQVRVLQQCGRFPDALAAARVARTVAQRIAWDEGISVAEQMVLSLEAR